MNWMGHFSSIIVGFWKTMASRAQYRSSAPTVRAINADYRGPMMVLLTVDPSLAWER
jgi:hypothetical protein